MPRLDPNAIPGLLDAVAHENIIRDAAFLPVTESIGDFEVTAMTVRQWLILRIAGNPLLVGGVPSPVQLAQFLWVLNPGFSPEGKARARFLKVCRKRFYSPRRPFLKWFLKRWERKDAKRLGYAMRLIAECRKYLADTFLDRPPIGSPGSFSPALFSDPAFFGSYLGRSDEEIQDMSLKRLFQHYRAQKFIKSCEAGREPHIGNPSSRIIADFMAKKNAERQN